MPTRNNLVFKQSSWILGQDFCKIWRFNESHKKNQRYTTSSAKNQIVFNLIPENQSIVSSIQLIVFICSV